MYLCAKRTLGRRPTLQQVAAGPDGPYPRVNQVQVAGTPCHDVDPHPLCDPVFDRHVGP